MKIKDRDIVVMGIQAWDIEIGSNCKNIAAEFARHNRVLYVNPPLDRFTSCKDRKKPGIALRRKVQQGKAPDLVQISDRMWNLNPMGVVESVNKLPWPALFDHFNRRNNRLLARAILSAMKRLDFSRIILFNDSSMFLGLHQKDLLNPDVYVYYMRDYLVRNPYWRRQGVRLEPKLIARADVVVCNSTLYADYGRKYNPHSYMVGQGCDVSLFNDTVRSISLPGDMHDIPRPVLGYVGFLSSRRLDIKLLEKLASARPGVSMVLVGPEDEAFKNSALHSMSNVHFLGSRDAEDLPSYIKAFDVCMNPQLVNDATMGNYPRKIDEYLAMGKPVLATNTPAMEYFKEHVFLAGSLDDYLENLKLALQSDSDELRASRRAFAQSHTWENNVGEIYKAIEKVSK